MQKVKIIRSDSLECLRGQINNKIMDYHRMVDQIMEELSHLDIKSENHLAAVRKSKELFELRIECYRDALNDIALFESEIEI